MGVARMQRQIAADVSWSCTGSGSGGHAGWSLVAGCVRCCCAQTRSWCRRRRVGGCSRGCQRSAGARPLVPNGSLQRHGQPGTALSVGAAHVWAPCQCGHRSAVRLGAHEHRLVIRQRIDVLDVGLARGTGPARRAETLQQLHQKSASTEEARHDPWRAALLNRCPSVSRDLAEPRPAPSPPGPPVEDPGSRDRAIGPSRPRHDRGYVVRLRHKACPGRSSTRSSTWGRWP